MPSVQTDFNIWQVNPAQVSLGDAFASIREAEAIQYKDEVLYPNDPGNLNPAFAQVQEAPSVDLRSHDTATDYRQPDKIGPNFLYEQKFFVRDTSLGGNECINPLPQYCRNDDIRIPASRNTGHSDGIGRVYAKEIFRRQQILWLCPCRPVYNNLVAFYDTMVFKDLVNLFSGNIAKSCGALFGKTLILAATCAVAGPLVTGVLFLRIPMLALRTLARVAKVDVAPITRYYDITPQTILAYRYINTMQNYHAVNLGCLNSADEFKPGNYADPTSRVKPGEDKGIDPTKGSVSVDSVDYNQEIAFDIGRLLLRRQELIYQDAEAQGGHNPVQDYHWVQNQGNVTPGWSSDGDQQAENELTALTQDNSIATEYAKKNAATLAQDQSNVKSAVGGLLAPLKPKPGTAQAADASGLSNDPISHDGAFAYWVKGGAAGVDIGANPGLYLPLKYIGIRIPHTPQSISWGNSFTKSPIADTLNSRMKTVRSTGFALGSISNIPGVKQVTDFFSGAVGGAADMVGLGGLASMATGNVLVDVPKFWDDSSMTRSFNFNLTERACAGDPQSILNGPYLVLSCLMALTCARATGAASYTGPFLVKAWSKGLFSCPLGAITNLTVSYHEKQHSTTINKLPTEVSFSFTIEDLSPTMYMAMSYGSSWDGVKGALLGDTSNFAEFLKALGGVDWNNDVGLAGLKRRMAILWRNFKGTTLNPVLGGMSIGNLGVSRIAYRLINLASAGSLDKVTFSADNRQ